MRHVYLERNLATILLTCIRTALGLITVHRCNVSPRRPKADVELDIPSFTRWNPLHAKGSVEQRMDDENVYDSRPSAVVSRDMLGPQRYFWRQKFLRFKVNRMHRPVSDGTSSNPEGKSRFVHSAVS